MKKKGCKYYYNDKINNCYVSQVKDIYMGGDIVKKSFCYKDNYMYSKEEAELNAKTLSEYLILKREEKLKPLKYYLNDIKFENHMWD